MRILTPHLTLIVVMLMYGCTNVEDSPITAVPVATSTIEYEVSGMTCTGCESAIKSRLARIKGVTECEASHVDGKVIVKTTDPDVNDEIVEAVSSMNFTIKPVESGS